MATLEELVALRQDSRFSDLTDRAMEAAKVKAVAVAQLSPPTARQLEWAQETLRDPVAVGRMAVEYVIAKRRDGSTEDILKTSDADLQAAVDESVDRIMGVVDRSQASARTA